jgi:hypothetical protein
MFVTLQMWKGCIQYAQGVFWDSQISADLSMHPKEVSRLPSFCRAKQQKTLEDLHIQKEF